MRKFDSPFEFIPVENPFKVIPQTQFKFKEDDVPKLIELCHNVNRGRIPAHGLSFTYKSVQTVDIRDCTLKYLETMYKDCRDPVGKGLFVQYHRAITKLCKYELNKRKV